jgi:hypothetical protein
MDGWLAAYTWGGRERAGPLYGGVPGLFCRVHAPANRHNHGLRRRFGVLKGKVRVADDFDAPLPDDVLAGFEGR